MKILTNRREYPPYYLGSLALLYIAYFFTIGNYFNDAPHHWMGNKVLAYLISFVLFVGGLLICQAIFDRLYPHIESKRLEKRNTKAPLILKVAAFIFDLILSFFVAISISLFLLGHRTANSVSLSGWRASLPVVLVFLYFLLMSKYAGGTIGKRVFGINKNR